MIRENSDLKRGSKAQEVITKADKEKLEKLTVENADVKAQVERTKTTETKLEKAKTWSSGSGGTVRNLIKETNFLKRTLRWDENQTEATEIKLDKVEKSKSDLETELAKTKNVLVEANTSKSKSEDLWNKGPLTLRKRAPRNKGQFAERGELGIWGGRIYD